MPDTPHIQLEHVFNASGKYFRNTGSYARYMTSILLVLKMCRT